MLKENINIGEIWKLYNKLVLITPKSLFYLDSILHNNSKTPRFLRDFYLNSSAIHWKMFSSLSTVLIL